MSVHEQRALTYLYSFRRIVPAVALLAAGAGWIAQAPWLVAAGLAIGIGEWLESSYYIGVLRRGHHAGRRAQASPENLA